MMYGVLLSSYSTFNNMCILFVITIIYIQINYMSVLYVIIENFFPLKSKILFYLHFIMTKSALLTLHI